ncbi:MAG: carbon-nitrogen hydrolase family protein [Planctomycetes bacterium]|nr:carbon-nitrogen hydrolase family protein [Planctomycetota bacterium]
MPSTALPVAVLAFTAQADLVANAAAIRQGLAQAAAAGAQLLLTPECALTGYPGAAREGLAGINWCQAADLEESLEEEAVRRGVTLVLGTAAPVAAADGARPMLIANEAVVIGAEARPLRYRKRALTPLDTRHFVPGGQPCTFHCAGWTLGLAICYELRFGALWAELAALEVDAFVTIAHMAGNDVDPGTKQQVIPALYSARAAEWATPLLLANTAAPDRWLDSGLWDARGVRVSAQAEGLLLATLRPRDALDPWYMGLRSEALKRERER